MLTSRLYIFIAILFFQTEYLAFSKENVVIAFSESIYLHDRLRIRPNGNSILNEFVYNNSVLRAKGEDLDFVNNFMTSKVQKNFSKSADQSINSDDSENTKEVKNLNLFSSTPASSTKNPTHRVLENSLIDSTQKNVAGIVNIYTPVIEIGNECVATIHVKNSSGFSVGDKVLIIQMQGAHINESNSSDYGSIIDYGNCGNHEFSRIIGISDNIIQLQSSLLHQYTMTGKVQCIRVPEYKNVIVNGELTCKQWDGETGGVLVFSASEKTTLLSDINVNGKGFRGAKAIGSGDYPDYYVGDYIVDNDKPGYSAPKGEGIAEYGVEPFTNGRGAPANGGGGGGNHNTGGAGGSNYGCGGNGSVGWVSTHYSGDNKTAQSIGGYPLAVSKGRIFMGGGGGAGHSNQDDLGHGGNGGGIVILITQALESNEHTISAEGSDGTESSIDGSGGGGGGGNIFLDVVENVNLLNLSVKGGNGANNLYTRYDHPPGGGGGGGGIMFKNDFGNKVIDIEGGTKGSTGFSVTDYGAKSGCRGTIVSNVGIDENSSTGNSKNAQTLPNLYYPVMAINDEMIRVTVDKHPELCIGNKVLIIQMQGAEVNTALNNEFGKVISLNSCGNYEFSRIAYIEGNEVFLQNPLKRIYNTAGKVQLVTVPEYQELTIESPLSCKSWDGKIGGVLVFTVDETLLLNSKIDVSGKGFRGGKVANSFTNPPAHTSVLASPFDSTSYSRKGEGIYVSSITEEAGRGSLANAGGGGNNHNAGGGGGSNLTCGGDGGYGWAQYNGDRTIAQGIGGYSLVNNENKLFLGGGGGAGHSNEMTGTSGGSGGGIIIIQARRISSKNESIIAKGISSANAAFDGCGGGGAGGTIILDYEEIINRLYIDVQGGSGGSTTDHRDGPGGGGGGGVISLAIKTIQNITPLINGGGAGNNRDFSNDGATDGCDGTLKTNFTLYGDSNIVASNSEMEIDHYKSKRPSLYPNPAVDVLTIKLEAVNKRFTVFDDIGQTYVLPFTQYDTLTDFDVTSLQSGIYFLKIEDNIYPFIIAR